MEDSSNSQETPKKMVFILLIETLSHETTNNFDKNFSIVYGTKNIRCVRVFFFVPHHPTKMYINILAGSIILKQNQFIW